MSVTITIQHAVKRYGANTVIADLSLAIRNGEFSPCSALRAVARRLCCA